MCNRVFKAIVLAIDRDGLGVDGLLRALSSSASIYDAGIKREAGCVIGNVQLKGLLR